MNLFSEFPIVAVAAAFATATAGLRTSVLTAHRGYGELAFSNAIGGIAAQTMFLAIADLCYRRANLEHVAASTSNTMQASLLIALLSLPVMGIGSPKTAFIAVHPASIGIIALYLFGIRLIHDARAAATWAPEETDETVPDVPDNTNQRLDVNRLLATFVLTALCVAGAGWVVAESGMALADRTGLSESLIGGVLTAVATSLPELVTTIAAVRMGALTLAVGNILGGNSFDTLFLAVADASFRGGSIYAAIGDRQLLQLGAVLLMNAVLVLGLLRRQKRGIAGIGFESAALLSIYAALLVAMIRS